jgi:tetratricopeptide (TPR) repeat protein
MNINEISNKAKFFYNNKNYTKSIKLYNIILLSTKNSDILINISICYLKINDYINAHLNISKYIENNITNQQAWGILGAAFYGLNKKNDSLMAYNKAYELSKKNIYKIMIDKINNTKFNSFLKNPNMNNIFNSILSNNKIVDKLKNKSFQNKLFALKSNPQNIINDPEVMEIMTDMMKKIF